LKENVEWLVHLPYISKYYFHHFFLLRPKLYVGNVYHWRIEVHVVLFVYEFVFGRRVNIFKFQICICVFFTNQSNSLHYVDYIIGRCQNKMLPNVYFVQNNFIKSLLSSNYSYHSFKCIIFMRSSILDLQNYVDTVF
jgi:hypothetical protein